MLKIDKIENVTRDLLLNALSRNKTIVTAINNVTRNHPYHSQELLQELFVILLSLEEEKLLRIYNDGELESYIMGIIKMMYSKTKSSFYKKIVSAGNSLGESIRVDHIDENEIDLLEVIPAPPALALPDKSKRSTDTQHQYTEELEIGLQKLKPYYQQVIKLYLKYGSLSKIVKGMEIYAGKPISKESVRKIFNNAKRELRNHIKKGIAPLLEENFHNY